MRGYIEVSLIILLLTPHQSRCTRQLPLKGKPDKKQRRTAFLCKDTQTLLSLRDISPNRGITLTGESSSRGNPQIVSLHMGDGIKADTENREQFQKICNTPEDAKKFTSSGLIFNNPVKKRRKICYNQMRKIRFMRGRYGIQAGEN